MIKTKKEFQLEYKNFSRIFYDEKYIITLAKQYHQNYPQVELKHVGVLVDHIIKAIVLCFTPSVCEDDNMRLYAAQAVKALTRKEFSKAEVKKIPYEIVPVYIFSRGDLIDLTNYFEKNNMSKDDIEYKYLEEISKKITKQQVDIIANAMINSLPIALKVDPNKYEANHEFGETKHDVKSFVERFAKKPR